jgi:aconitate hydratase
MYLGVKLVLARSIERIHLANLVNFGILPCIFADAAAYGRILPGDRIEHDDLHAALRGEGRLLLRDATRGFEFEVRAELTERQRRLVAAGGLLTSVVAATT